MINAILLPVVPLEELVCHWTADVSLSHKDMFSIDSKSLSIATLDVQPSRGLKAEYFLPDGLDDDACLAALGVLEGLEGRFRFLIVSRGAAFRKTPLAPGIPSKTPCQLSYSTWASF